LKSRFAALAAALAMLPAASARAQSREDPLGGAYRSMESSQNFAAEMRFAAFTPDIDSDPALQGKTPYKDAFGSSPRVLVSFEFDWQAYRIPHFGTVGPGAAVGYTKMSDPAQFVTAHNGSFTSGETTSLEIFPFYGVIVLRADVLWHEFGIPLVPYGKIGLGFALWHASNTLGTSVVDGVTGEGTSFGAQYAVGLAINLNPLDAYAAKTFDDTVGVNNSYIFAEWTQSDLSGLGIQKNALRVGGTSWTFGLAFEF
jgi:hypothetical protein